jgi:hypothetical protein
LLWGVGVVLVVLGFVIPVSGGPDAFAALVAVGVVLGLAGFLTFAKRDQGTTA